MSTRSALPLLLPMLAASCNPYRDAAELPPARCRTDGDCPTGESCVHGTCGLTGWVQGRVRPLVQSGSPSRDLRLAVYRWADLGQKHIRPGARSVGILESFDANGRYRFGRLPRGRFVVVATCRRRSTVAGTVGFEARGGQGFIRGLGAARQTSVDIPVDTARCRR